jgi:hypothetical protein
MKIMAVSGSPRKTWNTATLLRKIGIIQRNALKSYLYGPLLRPAAGLPCRWSNKPGGSILNGRYWSQIAFHSHFDACYLQKTTSKWLSYIPHE